MRQIILDTETTGLSHEAGHRIIEIGCIELINRRRSGKTFHAYINPMRAVDEGAFRVHGISTEFLQDKPDFQAIVADLMGFLEGAELVIHNASFDMGFLGAELKLVQWPKSLESSCTVLDTLALARKKHPGQRNTLDALCKRYDVNNANRQLHGALLDAELLTAVYLAMTGGQASLFEDEGNGTSSKEDKPVPAMQAVLEKLKTTTTLVPLSAEEQSRHEEFLEFLKKKSAVCLWD